jgi:ABC-type cobalamin transport system permease subunit
MRLSALAGGANAADTIEGYKPMTDEGVIAAAPDVILKMNTLVGIVAPHAVRLIVGPDHRALLPLSVALGATLLSGADVLARTWVTPAEMPIGILTAAVGAPFFLWLLMRRGGGFGI